MIKEKIEEWINNPGDISLTEVLSELSNKKIDQVKYSESIIKGLEYIKNNFDHSNFKDLNSDIFALTVFFQNASSKDTANYFNSKGIPLLIDVFNLNLNTTPGDDFTSDPGLMILKICALYNNEYGFSLIVKCMKDSYNKDDYLWSIILSSIYDSKVKLKYIVNGLKDFLPEGFICVSYLDLINAAMIGNKLSNHVFNSEEGFNMLLSYLNENNEERYSYAVSAVTSIPFLKPEYQKELLSLAVKHPDINVKIEASWAGAKSGLQTYTDMLVEYTKDYRYSWKAIEYLQELKLDNLIPPEVNDEDFLALTEMCKWLSHPNEFGLYPDKAEIFDKRELYWPPQEERRTMYLIKYTYINFHKNGVDESGIGCLGSVTFSFFGIKDIIDMSPLEIYAMHCNWEMGNEDWQNIDEGIHLLKINNDL